MKILTLLLACLAAASPILAEEFGFSENFDNGPGSIAFERFRTYDGQASAFPFSQNGGVGRSGAVGLNPGIGVQFWAGNQPTAARMNLGALPEGSTITTSADLKVRPDFDGLTVLTFGFTLNERQGALTHDRGKNVSGSLFRAEGSPTFVLRMRSDSNDLDTLEIAPDTLFEGEWYRLVLTLAKSPGGGRFNYTLALYSIGADGSSPPALFNDGTRDISLKGTIDNGEVLESSEARWAVDARSSFDHAIKEVRGIVVIDNLTLTKSP